MIVGIHQPQYWPWLGYLDKIEQSDIFVLLDNVQFKKNEWQNRNRILTPDGWQWLTVPVIHDFGQKINEVKINNKTNWREKHLKTIEINYCKTAYFAKYHSWLTSLYQRNWEHLSEINIRIIKDLVVFLGIETKIVVASDYAASEDSTQRLIDLCQHFNADTYLSGVDGAKYMDPCKFQQANIKVITQQYRHPQYAQLYRNEKNDGFISHLSVIDLLLNHGDKSLKILKGDP